MNELLPVVVRASVLAAGLLLGASGCARTVNKLPGIYRIDIQQGNVVDQAMLDRLALGMDKGKVQFALGTPLLTDTFNDDRWEYVYSYRRGSQRRVQRRVTLHFEEEQLAYIEGDVKIGDAKRPPPPRRETMVTVPPAEPPGLLAAIMPKFLGGKRGPKLPHEAPEPTESATEAADSTPPASVPPVDEAEPGASTDTAAAPDTSDQSSVDTAAVPRQEPLPVETTEPYQRSFTTYGGDAGRETSGTEEAAPAAATPTPGLPPTTGTVAPGIDDENFDSQTRAEADYVVGEESESVGIPADDDAQRGFFNQLVDRFHEAEPAEDADAGASASGAESDPTVPAP